MSDVFISYSRLDKTFVAQLREALATKKQEIWIDWESIPPSQAWWTEIKKGIAKANNFVLVMSPNSMASPICQMEIEYARELKKRIIPVYHADYDRETCLIEITKRLAKKEETTTREIWGNRQAYTLYDENIKDINPINYFFFKVDADFDTRFDELFKIIRTDYAHKEQHTTLELRALEWERRGRNISFLLLDDELAHAEEWLKNTVGKEPPPTDLHLAYTHASEKRTRQLQNIRRASIIGSMVAGLTIVLAAWATIAGIQANTSANQAQTREANSNIEAVTQVADANSQLATAEKSVNNADTQVAVVAVTATQAAILQDIVGNLANVMVQSEEISASRSAAMSALIKQYPDQPYSYVARGLAYNAQGQFNLAIADYTQALELDPTFAMAHLNRANTYSDQGQFNLAIADYTQALELDPTFAMAYSNRGNAYRGLGKMDLALTDYKNALELDPTFATAYNNRAYAYFEQGNIQQAVTDMTKAIQLAPDVPYYYDSRCEFYLKSEQWVLGVADCEKAFDMGWTFSDEMQSLLVKGRQQVVTLITTPRP